MRKGTIWAEWFAVEDEHGFALVILGYLVRGFGLAGAGCGEGVRGEGGVNVRATRSVPV